ncbi:MAG TPA: hypothetical protein VIV40_37780 [Kofleriaceae bacterium]
MRRLALLVTLAAIAGCVETRDPITGTQSLKVELVSPAVPGTPDSPLQDDARTLVINVTALDPQGALDTSFNNPVRVYVNFLGTLTPYLDMPPLMTITMSAGQAMNQTVMLPQAFGPSTLWLDDAGAPEPTYASGASPTLWYRDPFIADIQEPVDEMALDALQKSPLEQKQVTVRGSRSGVNGRLVVTSVFAQGYTVSDVLCGANGASPCALAPNPRLGGALGYDHKMVFSFSAPRDEHFRLIKEGQFIDGFAGGVSEFNGLTELGFPQTFVDGDNVDVDPARIPTPATFDPTWFTNKYMFERNEAAPISVAGAKVCDLDKDYTSYKQWKLDPAGVGGNCIGKNVINVISNGVIPTDPMTLVGKTLPKVTGVLRPVNIGSFNVWIIYPRSSADLVLQ